MPTGISNSTGLPTRWKYNDIGYYGKHQRIRYVLGKPMKCEYCEVEVKNSRAIDWANIKHNKISSSYSTNPKDYVRLCKSCHRLFDRNPKMRELMLDFL